MAEETHDLKIDKRTGIITIDDNEYLAHELIYDVVDPSDIKIMIIKASNGDQYRFETQKDSSFRKYGPVGDTIDQFQIDFPQARDVSTRSHPHYEIEPYVYYATNASGSIFQELKQMCESVSKIQVDLNGGEPLEFRCPCFVADLSAMASASGDEAFWLQGQHCVHIFADQREGWPQLIKKTNFAVRPDGTPFGEVTELVIRKFQMQFYSQHETTALTGEDPYAIVVRVASNVVKYHVRKYLDAISSKYACFLSSTNAPDDDSNSRTNNKWVHFPSQTLSEMIKIWASERDGVIKSTVNIAFSVIYPASMEMEPQRLGPYNPDHPRINYSNFIPSLIPEIEIKNNTLVGTIEQHCPYCHVPLPKFPKKKVLCPKCKQSIYPRLRGADKQYVLLTKKELDIYEAEQRYYTLYGSIPGRATKLANKLKLYQLFSDRWKFQIFQVDHNYWGEAITPDALAFMDRIILMGSPEEKDAIKALLRPENYSCTAKECKTREYSASEFIREVIDTKRERREISEISDNELEANIEAVNAHIEAVLTRMISRMEEEKRNIQMKNITSRTFRSARKRIAGKRISLGNEL